MSRNQNLSSPWLKIGVFSCFLLAIVAWVSPRTQMPLNYHAMLWWSLPLAGLWLVAATITILRFHARALWLLMSAPFALYWPVWLLINGLPACYWQGNCV